MRFRMQLLAGAQRITTTANRRERLLYRTLCFRNGSLLNVFYVLNLSRLRFTVYDVVLIVFEWYWLIEFEIMSLVDDEMMLTVLLFLCLVIFEGFDRLYSFTTSFWLFLYVMIDWIWTCDFSWWWNDVYGGTESCLGF